MGIGYRYGTFDSDNSCGDSGDGGADSDYMCVKYCFCLKRGGTSWKQNGIKDSVDNSAKTRCYVLTLPLLCYRIAIG